MYYRLSTLLLMLQPALAAISDLDCLSFASTVQEKGSSIDDLKQFLSEDVVLKLPWTGVYKGREAAAEYTKFFQTSDGLFEVTSLENLLDYRGIVDGKYCKFRELAIGRRYSNGTISGVTDVTNVLMNLYLVDPVLASIVSIDVFLPPEYIKVVVTELVHNSRAYQFICDTLINKCPQNIRSANGNLTMEECKTWISALPATTDNYYIDGNSLGCRLLHSTMAFKNPHDHCPHISLVPFADSFNRTKCYKSALLDPIDVIGQEDLDGFVNYTASFPKHVDINGFRMNKNITTYTNSGDFVKGEDSDSSVEPKSETNLIKNEASHGVSSSSLTFVAVIVTMSLFALELL